MSARSRFAEPPSILYPNGNRERIGTVLLPHSNYRLWSGQWSFQYLSSVSKELPVFVVHNTSQNTLEARALQNLIQPQEF